MAKLSEEERRVGMNELKTDVALIKQKTEFIEEKIVDIVNDMRDVKTALDNSEPVTKHDWDNHIIQDRWLFSIIITLILGVLGILIKLGLN